MTQRTVDSLAKPATRSAIIGSKRANAQRAWPSGTAIDAANVFTEENSPKDQNRPTPQTKLMFVILMIIGAVIF